jgi:hypothetical protein
MIVFRESHTKTLLGRPSFRDGVVPPSIKCHLLLPVDVIRAITMEETDIISIAKEIIYRNYLPQW